MFSYVNGDTFPTLTVPPCWQQPFSNAKFTPKMHLFWLFLTRFTFYRVFSSMWHPYIPRNKVLSMNSSSTWGDTFLTARLPFTHVNTPVGWHFSHVKLKVFCNLFPVLLEYYWTCMYGISSYGCNKVWQRQLTRKSECYLWITGANAWFVDVGFIIVHVLNWRYV